MRISVSEPTGTIAKDGLRRRAYLFMASLAFAFAMLTPSFAASQSIGYTISPTALYINWAEQFGLDDATLYGGRFGFTFGGLVGLQGFYMTNSEVRSALGATGLLGPGDSPLVDQDVRSRTYGADLLVDVGRSRLRPFIKAGGAIMNFEPSAGQESDQIALNYGGGIRFGGPGSVQLQLSVQNWLMRSDRYRYAVPDPDFPFALDPERDDVRHNLSFGASLNVPIGGQNSAGVDERWNFGATLPLEVFAGRLEFDDATSLAKQDVAGIRGGVDFGSLVGLRAYYWRGVESGFDRIEPIQSWGAEAQFNLNTGPGLSPFLIAGAGRVDFLDDYRDLDDLGRKDQSVLILGGGIGMQLTEAIRLNFTARDYLFSQRDLEDVASPDELQSNWMFSAGMAFRIGRNSRDSQNAPVRPTFTNAEEERRYLELQRMERERVERERLERERMERQGMTAAERERLEMERRRMMAGATVTEQHIEMRRQETMLDEIGRMGGPENMTLRMIIRDELERDRIIQERDQLRRERDELLRGGRMGGMQMGSAGQGGMNTIEMPGRPGVPMTQDELINYIDAMVSRRIQAERDSMRMIIRDEFNRFMQGSGGTMPPPVTQDMISTMVRDEMSRMGARPVSGAQSGGNAQQQPGVAQSQRQWDPSAWSAYSGFTLSSGSQMLLGLRTTLGSISGNSPVMLAPEIAFGFGGGGTSFLLAANAQYRIANFNVTGLGVASPYIGLGLGFLNFSDPVGVNDGLSIVVNPAWGAAVRVGSNSGVLGLGAPEFFVEHQGIAFFDINRLLAGLRWAF